MNSKTIVRKWLVRGVHPGEYATPDQVSTKTLIDETYMQEAHSNEINLKDAAIVYEYVEEDKRASDSNKADHWHQTTTLFDTALVSKLEGKLLTYVDATYTDLEQRKAHKSLIRALLWDTYNSANESALLMLRHAETAIAKELIK